jgi:hypothetical protein
MLLSGQDQTGSHGAVSSCSAMKLHELFRKMLMATFGAVVWGGMNESYPERVLARGPWTWRWPKPGTGPLAFKLPWASYLLPVAEGLENSAGWGSTRVRMQAANVWVELVQLPIQSFQKVDFIRRKALFGHALPSHLHGFIFITGVGPKVGWLALVVPVRRSHFQDKCSGCEFGG